MTTKLAVVDRSPTALLKELPGWEEMSIKDQAYIEKETRGLAEACSKGVMSKIEQGRHLYNVRQKATPQQFETYYKTFNISKSNALGYVAGYKLMSGHIRPSLIAAAAARGMNILGKSKAEPFGVWTDDFKSIPPPDTDDQDELGLYLDQRKAQRARRDGRNKKMKEEADVDPEMLLKACYQFVSRRLQSLPNRGRARKVWLDRLAGMLLSELGVSGSQSFQAEAAPEGFKPRPKGRPPIRTIEAA